MIENPRDLYAIRSALMIAIEVTVKQMPDARVVERYRETLGKVEDLEERLKELSRRRRARASAVVVLEDSPPDKDEAL